MDRSAPRSLSIAALILVFAAGCGPSPTVSPAPSATPTSAPAPTVSACALGGSPRLEVEMEPVEAITHFLNDGGDPIDLAPRLYDLGWVTPGSAFVNADLESDGVAEIGVGLAGPLGGIYLWRCRGGQYVPIEVLSGREPPFGPPVLEGVIDLTGDSLPELVAFHPICGAHTCFAQYLVLQWDGEGVVDLLRGKTDDLPSPEWSADPARPGEPSRLSITAAGIGSVGAGPFRRMTRTWTWDEARSAFLPTADIVEAPRYRIHLVHDADAALEAGELEQAVTLFQKVIDDDGLMDWPSPDSRGALSAYAAYRMILASLALGSPTRAEAIFEANLAKVSGPGVPFAALGRLLLAGYAEAGLPAACATLLEAAGQDPASYLTALDFGYANRTYTVGDLCPYHSSG